MTILEKIKSCTAEELAELISRDRKPCDDGVGEYFSKNWEPLLSYDNFNSYCECYECPQFDHEYGECLNWDGRIENCIYPDNMHTRYENVVQYRKQAIAKWLNTELEEEP